MAAKSGEVSNVALPPPLSIKWSISHAMTLCYQSSSIFLSFIQPFSMSYQLQYHFSNRLIKCVDFSLWHQGGGGGGALEQSEESVANASFDSFAPCVLKLMLFQTPSSWPSFLNFYFCCSCWWWWWPCVCFYWFICSWLAAVAALWPPPFVCTTRAARANYN